MWIEFAAANEEGAPVGRQVLVNTDNICQIRYGLKAVEIQTVSGELWVVGTYDEVKRAVMAEG